VKRKRAKARPRGTGCQFGRRCIAIEEHNGLRYCAVHLADALTGEAVKARDGQCRSCGADGPLDWAHCHSRRYRSIRWDLANSVALCRRCHARYTSEPTAWEQWCRDNGVPWDSLRYVALNGEPMRPLDVIERLRAAA
jgi:hypothetical protein